jgi:hypothetical protein
MAGLQSVLMIAELVRLAGEIPVSTAAYVPFLGPTTRRTPEIMDTCYMLPGMRELG